MLFVLSVGAVWAARLSPCCEKARPERWWKRLQAHLEKAPEAVAAEVGAPKAPAGPDRGVSAFQMPSGGFCHPRSCALCTVWRQPWSRLLRGRKKICQIQVTGPIDHLQ